MKKLIAIFMCLVLCLSMFAACGKQEGGEEQQDAAADVFLFLIHSGFLRNGNR